MMAIRLVGRSRPSKFGARACWVDPRSCVIFDPGPCVPGLPKRAAAWVASAKASGWVRCDSRAEGRRYVDLLLRQRAGEIQNLDRQVRWPLRVGVETIGHYVADFVYVVAATGEVVIEDVKGVRTPMFAWKMRHFRAEYGFSVVEVTR